MIIDTCVENNITLNLNKIIFVFIMFIEELDSALGSANWAPEWKDKECLSYTMAVIYEVMRHVSVAAFTLQHETMEDVTIGGYHIPKGTEVCRYQWILFLKYLMQLDCICRGSLLCYVYPFQSPFFLFYFLY